MISLQTNVDSLVAQSNLNVDSAQQSKTIQQLTSGYRINNSSDDAAGLAIANQYRDQIAELSQGVNNANNGVSQLQIVDGGLGNISTILDRMKTLATESASSTLTGSDSRATLNQEYQTLVGEITRQANNIGLDATGGSAGDYMNSKLNIYIGGANSNSATENSNDGVTVDLSGSANAVDAQSLSLTSTSVLGNTTGFAGNTTNLSNGVTLANSETFTLNAVVNGAAQQSTITVAAGTYNSQGILNSLNTQLSQAGITASLNSSGQLQFSGSSAFNITDTTAAPGLVSTGQNSTLSNTGNYIVEGAAAYTQPATNKNETLTVTANGQTYSAVLTHANDATAAAAVADINTQLAGSGVFALQGQTGAIEFQSANSFAISTAVAGGGGESVFAATGSQVVTAPNSGANPTSNAQAAITAINNAISQLGLVQGKVGAGENLLNYAIGLAQSQITNYSSAQSSIRDANVAADASNLTKSQVLQQTAVAAMAQANSEPQAVLKLLQ